MTQPNDSDPPTLQSAREKKQIAARQALLAERAAERTKQEGARAAQAEVERAEKARQVEAERIIRGPLEPGEVRVRLEAADGSFWFRRVMAPLLDADFVAIGEAATTLSAKADVALLERADAELARLAAVRKGLEYRIRSVPGIVAKEESK